MFSPDCPECQRLWNLYASATLVHIRLESRLKMADLCRELQQIEILSDLVRQAAWRREMLDQAVKHHDQAIHSHDRDFRTGQ